MHHAWILIVVAILLMETNCQGPDCDVEPQDIVVPLGVPVNATCLLRVPTDPVSLHWQLGSKQIHSELSVSTRPGTLSVSLSGLALSPPSGHNLLCFKEDRMCYGTVVYVGEPPVPPMSVSCETPDLKSLSCVWKPGNRTHVGKFTPNYTLTYSSGNRSVTVDATETGRVVELLDRLSGFSITVTTQNRLGVATATEMFPTAMHALRPPPPQELKVEGVGGSDPPALNVSWLMTPHLSDVALNFEACAFISGSDRPLCAELPMSPPWADSARGTRPQLLLSPVPPYTALSVRLHTRGPVAGPRQWGPWGDPFALRSPSAVPLVTPDLWRMVSITTAGDKMAAIMWKAIGDTEARGKVRSYCLCLSSAPGTDKECHKFPSPPVNGWPLPPGATLPVAVTITVTNEAGASPPATVVITPRDYSTESVLAERIVGTSSSPSSSLPSSLSSPSLVLSWPPHPSPCGLVVQWSIATETGGHPCLVAIGNISRHSNIMSRTYWKRIGPNSTRATLNAEDELESYVRYAVCVYACAHNEFTLIKAAHTYLQEGTPVGTPAISVTDVSEQSVTLSWEPVPVLELRGFLTEYRLTWNEDRGIPRSISVPDTALRVLTVLQLSPRTQYWFTMAALTVQGAGPEGDPRPILTKVSFDPARIIVPVCLSITVGIILAVILCYHRQRLKNAFWQPIPSLFNLTWLRELVETKTRPVSLSPPMLPCFTDVDPCSLEIVSSYPQSPVSPVSSCVYGYKLEETQGDTETLVDTDTHGRDTEMHAGDTEMRAGDTGVLYSIISRDSTTPAIGVVGSEVLEEEREESDGFTADPTCLPVSSYLPQRTSS
uniref:Leukemia inhibitory factor receptor-like isoform X2 n=1 Tax=Petromyzon marinus TaxID=7757 RepID=A0AAJ7XDI9_PETMA|nr:leukemia inhibitory factor receptor-like isoform X2 [Petromyzon marinus]